MSRALIEKIQALRAQRNAVILAHNYQIGEVQDIADFVGDSLGLARQAAATDADVIVFCGVLFMAETAAILSPQRTVLLPDPTAGCPLADMITPEALDELKAEHPDALVVSYVNSPASIKARSDYCCTSGNAVELVQALPAGRPILFVPDQHLGKHVMSVTGREMILWPGYCPTHARMDAEAIEDLKRRHPDAVVMAHPECNDRIKALADEMLSTGQMLAFVGRSDARRFIVATENGILHTLRKQNPEKEFFSVSKRTICPNMKKITLEKVLWALEEMKHEIRVDDETAAKARRALDRMLEVLPSR
ncbi:MAG TPA: quinolinate synthase NadA [Phycisphaerales bacterium]|nr:quinolinate synthase NadA [Phycisphaerales bacterium]